MSTPKVEPPKDKWMRRIDIEQCFVGHNFPNTEIVLRIEALIKLQQEALLSKVEAELPDPYSHHHDKSAMDAHNNAIDQVKTTINKLRLEL